MGDLRDVITCAKFQIEIFMGYDFTGGVEFLIFLLTFAWALQQLQQCSANALPVIGKYLGNGVCQNFSARRRPGGVGPLNANLGPSYYLGNY